MTRPTDPDDPKGLIREAYLIEGIGPPECRSIFLDWALGLPGDPGNVIPRMLDGRPEDHPMSAVLREGMGRPARTGRRGGWAGRRG